MTDVLEFYSQPGALTDAGGHADVLEALPDDVGALAEIVSRTGIYDVVARDFYGVEVPPERAQEVHLRSVEGILAGALALDDAPLDEVRSPQDPAVLSLRRVHSAARRGAARARRPGQGAVRIRRLLPARQFEDHWVAEGWEARQGRWRLVDAQIDDVWRARLDMRDDALDLPRDRFLVAAEAWQRCRAGDEDAARFGISFEGLYGLWFVAGNLVLDLAALNKMEMLPWDEWGAQPAPHQRLDDEQLAFFDELAELTAEPDASFAELRRRYESDRRLRVPAQVFNALRDETEAIR